MKLGAFSVSLAVKDIDASLAFYEQLGFDVFGGDREHKWLILKNDTTLIGLFEGMLPGNLLTFNPGWNHNAQPLDDFDDVRQLYAQCENAGLAISGSTLGGDKGPGSFFVMDPDGNRILIDQHRE